MQLLPYFSMRKTHIFTLKMCLKISYTINVQIFRFTLTSVIYINMYSNFIQKKRTVQLVTLTNAILNNAM